MKTANEPPILSIRHLNIWYGDKQVLKSISFEVHAHQVTAFIGPTNSGKSTLIRCFNRLNDFTPNFKFTGDILFKGNCLYTPKDATQIRKQIGMVFCRPILFQGSIQENVAYGARISGVNRASALNTLVEKNLRRTKLWRDVKGILDETPEQLSMGQQQRLCVARALAAEPEVLIFDEPCGELDPIETVKIETLVRELANECTVIFATNKRRQAGRVSDVAGFLYGGELIEFGATEKIFTNPQDNRTERYVTGRLG